MSEATTPNLKEELKALDVENKKLVKALDELRKAYEVLETSSKALDVENKKLVESEKSLKGQLEEAVTQLTTLKKDTPTPVKEGFKRIYIPNDNRLSGEIYNGKKTLLVQIGAVKEYFELGKQHDVSEDVYSILADLLSHYDLLDVKKEG
jgi:predicted nuclease with TOPRIM domain